MKEYQKIAVYETPELAGKEAEFEEIKNGVEKIVKDLGIDYALELQEHNYATGGKRMSENCYVLVLIIRPVDTQRVVDVLSQLDGSYMCVLIDDEEEQEEKEIDPISSTDEEQDNEFGEDTRTLSEKYNDLTPGGTFAVVFFAGILISLYALEIILMVYNLHDFNVILWMVILMLCELYIYCKTVSNLLNRKKDDQ